MNIPDEYFTDDAPTQYGAYAIKHANGRTSAINLALGDDRKIWELLSPGVRFCRLAPAAEVERLKAENEKLRGLVYDAYAEGWYDCDRPFRWQECWGYSQSKARLERGAE